MQTRIFFPFLLILFFSTVNAQSTDSMAFNKSTDGNYLVSQLPFEIGERLVFRLRYGFIKAGEAEMKVLGLQQNEQGKYYHIQTTARSVSTFDWFYKVRDVVNSYMDASTLFPVHFEKLLREGSYKADTFVDYFQEDSIARVTYIRYKDGLKIKKKETYEVKIPTGVFDALSAFYYIRTLPFEDRKIIRIPAHEKRKVYDLEIKISGPEIIRVKAGKFRCYRLDPQLQGEGIFKHEGRITIWMTADQYKIPIQMTTKVVVGHITAELIKIKGISREIPARLD